MYATRTKNRNFVALAAAAVLTIATCATAFAEDRGTPEERKACTPDVMRLCLSSTYSVKAILACMVQKKDQLSPACRKVILGAVDRGPSAA
jgi:hypothetical protein